MDGKTRYSPIESVYFGDSPKPYRLYPNPATQGIYIHRQNDVDATKTDLKVEFVDVTGRIVAVQTVKSSFDTPIYAPFDGTTIQPGRYVVRLLLGGEFMAAYPLVVVR